MRKSPWNIFENSSSPHQLESGKGNRNDIGHKKTKIAAMIEALVIPKTIGIAPPTIDNMETSMPNTYTSQEVIKDTQITMGMLMMRVPIHKAPVGFNWVDGHINPYQLYTTTKGIRLTDNNGNILSWVSLGSTEDDSFTIQEMHLSMNPIAIRGIISILGDSKKLNATLSGYLYKEIMTYLQEIICGVMPDYRIVFPCRE